MGVGLDAGTAEVVGMRGWREEPEGPDVSVRDLGLVVLLLWALVWVWAVTWQGDASVAHALGL